MLFFVMLITKAVECVCVSFPANTLDIGRAKSRRKKIRFSLFLHSGLSIH